MLRHLRRLPTTILLHSIPSKITSPSLTFNKIKMVETITSFRSPQISSSNRTHLHKIRKLGFKYLHFPVCSRQGQTSLVYNNSSNNRLNSSNPILLRQDSNPIIPLQCNSKTLRLNSRIPLLRCNSSNKLTLLLYNRMLHLRSRHQTDQLWDKVEIKATKSNK